MEVINQNGEIIRVSEADQQWLDEGYFKQRQARLPEDAPRAILSYRVSTKKQVDHDDIPLQKIECRKYAQEHGWRVVDEKYEKGVSGSKVSATKRDAIQEIKNDALEGKFDILLVYMFDRLGRIESETPFVVEWFVSHNIRVWSTHEGEQRIESHCDKLINYIRFWQASGESEKTAIRTKDRLKQIVSSGHYAGGFVNYGYRLVNNGRVNKRDKPVMDLEKDPIEAEWVSEIFRKVAYEFASPYAMAKMLNERGIRTRNGVMFQSNVIIRIIRHRGYTGYIITRSAQSEFIPELQIVDDETFEKANEALDRRSAKRKNAANFARRTDNKTLLAGVVYCGHCGAKMSGFLHTDRYRLADGTIQENVQPKYNCYQRAQKDRTHRECDGQSLYPAERVDEAVLEVVRKIFEEIRDTPYSKTAQWKVKQQAAAYKSQKAQAERKIKNARHAQERFEAEILKCLDGTSSFTEEMIAKQLTKATKELEDAKAEYATIQNHAVNEAEELKKLNAYYNEFVSWANEFENASIAVKRVILCHLIERVEVKRGYEIKIILNLEYQQFLCNEERSAG